jgi:hypothetical protein
MEIEQKHIQNMLIGLYSSRIIAVRVISHTIQNQFSKEL